MEASVAATAPSVVRSAPERPGHGISARDVSSHVVSATVPTRLPCSSTAGPGRALLVQPVPDRISDGPRTQAIGGLLVASSLALRAFERRRDEVVTPRTDGTVG